MNSKDWYGLTRIMNACIYWHLDVVKVQIKCGNSCSKCGLKLVKMAYEMDQDKSM